MSDDIRLTKSQGMTNVMGVDTDLNFFHILSIIVRDIAKLLVRHCGPNSGLCMQISSNTAMEPVYTRDGINILNSVTSVDPIERAIYKQFAHIGSIVDRKIGDGTTTSMMLAAYMFESLREKYDTLHDSCFGMMKDFSEFKTAICQVLDSVKISVADIMLKYNVSFQTAVYWVAYHQAMTSSHGDGKLSEAVASAFSGTPPECWNTMTYEREPLATETRIAFTVCRDQYAIRARPLHPTMLTEDMGTRFSSDDCTLLVCSGTFTHGDTLKELKNYIETRDANSSGGDVVLLMPSNVDQVAERELYVYISSKTSFRFIVFYHDCQNVQLSDLPGIAVVSRQLPTHMTDKMSVHPNAAVHYFANILHLNRLYNNDTNSITHPDYKDETKPLNQFVTMLDTLVSKMKKERNTPQIQEEIRRILRIRNNVILTSRSVVVIGGSVYDNIATQDVLVDAMKAARCSLQSGVMMACNLDVIRVLRTMNTVMSNVMLECLMQICTCVFGEKIQSQISLLKGSEKWHTLYPSINGYNVPLSFDLLIPSKGSMCPDFYVPLQPAPLYEVMLECIEEVVLRLVSTTTVITEGAVKEKTYGH